jgi:hypothetical protein
MVTINSSTSYQDYFNSIRKQPPESETPGKVQESVDYYKHDAFAETPGKRSSPEKHTKDYCVRVNQSLHFWQHRVATA